jgi:hypothetical protein
MSEQRKVGAECENEMRMMRREKRGAHSGGFGTTCLRVREKQSTAAGKNGQNAEMIADLHLQDHKHTKNANKEHEKGVQLLQARGESHAWGGSHAMVA